MKYSRVVEVNIMLLIKLRTAVGAFLCIMLANFHFTGSDTCPLAIPQIIDFAKSIDNQKVKRLLEYI